jgi:hypothetical protein
MMQRCLMAILLLLASCRQQSNRAVPLPGPLESDPRAFFAGKPPWNYPAFEQSDEVAPLAQLAEDDYRVIEPRLKLRLERVTFDSDRNLLFLDFWPAEDSPIHPLDFILIYAYDRSTHHFIGRFQMGGP